MYSCDTTEPSHTQEVWRVAVVSNPKRRGLQLPLYNDSHDSQVHTVSCSF